ncbi:hypothetical protein ACFB49_20840 [Sphingomonas sp. DBB INV C78]
MAIWRPLADAGNADAQYNLGQAYRLGRGVKKDAKASREWYRKAAEQDHPQAQANYGLLLFGDGDRTGAMPWLNKAADYGDARAQFVVGTMLFNGNPPPRDWVRAYALMTRAAASGLPPAVSSLAEMDRYIPLDQRMQGQALAREMARGSATTKPTTPPPAKPAVASAPPAAAKAPPPQMKTSVGGGWRIQLGALADNDHAEALWRQLKAEDAGLSDLQHHLVPAGAVVRLQAGPFASSAAAEQACARIKAKGHACFPRRAP